MLDNILRSFSTSLDHIFSFLLCHPGLLRPVELCLLNHARLVVEVCQSRLPGMCTTFTLYSSGKLCGHLSKL
jgi:hypothetical protein